MATVTKRQHRQRGLAVSDEVYNLFAMMAAAEGRTRMGFFEVVVRDYHARNYGAKIIGKPRKAV